MRHRRNGARDPARGHPQRSGANAPTAAVPENAIRIAALVAALAVATPALPQEIRGLVKEVGTGTPIEGAIVIVLDEAEDRRGGVLTDEDGAFAVRTPGPGRYRLRIDRIGYASSHSDWLELDRGEVIHLEIGAPVAPIQIAGLHVEGVGRCIIRPAEGLAAARLWREARKALEATALTQAANAVSYRILRYERDLDVDRAFLRRQHLEPARITTGQPFVSRDAGDLARYGYIQTRADGRYYYMPDVRALLSDVFLDRHCFAVREDGVGSGARVGLEVRPIRDDGPPDIVGVLWLDSATSELRSFEFRYTRLERSFLENRIGGWARFERLPTGAWIIRRWMIRMPSIALESAWLGLKTEETLVGFREVGGAVLGAFTPEGKPFDRVDRAAIRGVVYDSVRREPLGGATVFVSGTLRATMSGPDGGFELRGLPPGRHLIGLRHPRLDTLGLGSPIQEIRIEQGGERRLRLAIPSRETIIDLLCSGRGRPGSDGVAFIGVRDDRTGEPLADARVSVTWVSRTRYPSGILQLPHLRAGQTGSAGVLRACGLPRNGTTFTAQASHGARKSEPVTFTLGPDGFARRDLRLPPPPDTVPVG